MKLCSCPLESMYCSKKCPGVYSALDKCYYSVPRSLQQTQFLQNMLDDFNIITTSPYLPTNAVLKTNIPFWIRVIFLWGNAVCFCRGHIQTTYEEFLEKLRHALWRSAVCISRCLTLLSKEQCPFRRSIFLHNICNTIDIEHPFQKCNMFETVSIIKECSFASYHKTTE